MVLLGRVVKFDLTNLSDGYLGPNVGMYSTSAFICNKLLIIKKNCSACNLLVVFQKVQVHLPMFDPIPDNNNINKNNHNNHNNNNKLCKASHTICFGEALLLSIHRISLWCQKLSHAKHKCSLD